MEIFHWLLWLCLVSAPFEKASFPVFFRIAWNNCFGYWLCITINSGKYILPVTFAFLCLCSQRFFPFVLALRSLFPLLLSSAFLLKPFFRLFVLCKLSGNISVFGEEPFLKGLLLIHISVFRLLDTYLPDDFGFLSMRPAYLFNRCFFF